MNLTKILSFVLLIVALGLGYYLYDNINSTIEFKAYITTTETEITDKLSIIREAEKAFLEQNGRFTSNWDSLINFIEHGQVPITVRTEKITQLSYGEEKVEVIIDTIGMMPAKDKIFKKTFALNASTEGTFAGFTMKPGDFVGKSAVGYKLKVGDKVEGYKLTEDGYVTSLANLKSGDPVSKGTNIATLWKYHLNPNINIKTLNIVPGKNIPFEIFTGKIDKSGIKVGVIEVKDPDPINPERKATNEAKNRQPLGFGSRTDVGTGGNWE